MLSQQDLDRQGWLGTRVLDWWDAAERSGA